LGAVLDRLDYFLEKKFLSFMECAKYRVQERGGMALPVTGRIDLTLESRVILVKNFFRFDTRSNTSLNLQARLETG
jgi:hypothetical protein